MTARPVNEDHPTVNEERPTVSDDLRSERVEVALCRVLGDAPPLTAAQVAHLRAVLSAYGPDDGAAS